MSFRLSLNYFIKILGAAAIVAASLIWRPHAGEAQRYLLSPPPYVEYFSFGHHEVIADFLWIRALQDFDYCEDRLSEILCKGNGWLYKMIDAITNLSPKFRIPYATGALTLTIIVSDIEGASKIFDKAVAAFPNDSRILYTAAYHAYFEEKDNIKAADLMKRAADNGAVPWLYSLAARLYTESGKKELGLRVYNDLKNNPAADPGILKRMAKKLGIPD